MLSRYVPKFHEYVSLPLFDAILDCLNACLIILDKMHVMCHTFELTIDVLGFFFLVLFSL